MLELKRARLKGQIPEMVSLDVDVMFNEHAKHIAIDVNDRLSSLDMRPLQGLVVAISGENQARTHAIAAAAVEAGAVRVITTVSRHNGRRLETVEVTDTMGEFTWKQ